MSLLGFLGVWVFVTLLPTLMLNNQKTDRPIGRQDYLGWALWATGMFFEIVADYQKTAFRNDPKNEVKILHNTHYLITEKVPKKLP